MNSFNVSSPRKVIPGWRLGLLLQSPTSVCLHCPCRDRQSMLILAVIRATHTQEVLGEQGRRIRELTSLIQKRFKFPENSVSLYAAKVQNRGLSAVAQCESLRYKLLNGLAVRRACYGVLRFIMESGAKGCEVVVSGKLRAARAKSMKFTVCSWIFRINCWI